MFHKNNIDRVQEVQDFLETHIFGLSNEMKLSNLIDSLNINKICQEQYLQNYALVKMTYKKKLSSTLTKEELKRHQFLYDNDEICSSLIKNDSLKTNNISKAYVFLALLSVYESEIQRSRLNFTSSDWEFFSMNVIFYDLTSTIEFLKEIFQNKQKYYKWNVEEDQFLQSLILSLNPTQTNKNKWKEICCMFNENKFSWQRRKPRECKERWENHLKNHFKNGDWTNEEDLVILNFVLKNGTKWSVLKKSLINRTEHSIKNRFFSLLCSYTSIPIKKIKKQVNYLSETLINETILHHQNEKSVSWKQDNNHYTQDPFVIFPESDIFEEKFNSINFFLFQEE